MSNERELMKLAARAANIKVPEWNDGTEPYSSGCGFILKNNEFWNPLTNDGDALRLAVKLEIVFEYRRQHRTAFAYHQVMGIERRVENTMLDPMVATRRAIVLVAAELAPQ